MGIKQTHTYAELELSKSAYDEIAKKLRSAGYDHAFMENGAIDMHGIVIIAADANIDEMALNATNEIMKKLADCGHAPYTQVKASVQTVVANVLRKCLES